MRERKLEASPLLSGAPLTCVTYEIDSKSRFCSQPIIYSQSILLRLSRKCKGEPQGEGKGANSLRLRLRVLLISPSP